MIILIRSKEIHSDSRASKYINYFIKNKIPYKLIEWDRRGDSKNINSINYPVISKYGVGGFKAVKGRLGWMKFVIQNLKKFEGDITIHACDLDCAFPAVFYKKFYNPHVKVVFDVFDWFSDTLFKSNVLIRLAFKYMERISTKYSDHIIICEPERIKQIPFKIDGKYSVLPNIPSFSSRDFLNIDSNYSFNNDKITISYVGSLEDHRCLDNLIDGAIQGYYNLLIAGFGNKRIEDRIKGTTCVYIKYFNMVEYSKGLNIMYNSDIIYAMYSPINPNHIFAAPNKYYETMFLGKPIITTKGTYVGEKVLNNNMGFVIDEDINTLISTIQSTTKKELEEYGRNNLILWEKYKNYFQEYMDNQYSLLISHSTE